MTELSREEQYKITSNHLTGLTALRKFANTKDYEWLETVASQLASIVEEKREAVELAKLEAEEREIERQKVLKMVSELGFTLESLSKPVTVKGKKAKKSKTAAPAKYHFTDPDTGKEDTYTGQGRMKKGLKKLLEQGHSLEEFLIQPENENN